MAKDPTGERFSDVYIEKALLGRILIERHIPQALRFLESGDFCSPLNRAIYVAMCALQARRAQVDFAGVMEQMRQDRTRNDLELAGGLFYLSECTDLYPALGRGRVYAQRVLDLASKRRVKAHDR
jgi:replicative DNA helicase